MRITHLLLTALLLCAALNTSAGVVLGGTRVIYPQDKKEIAVTLKNHDKSTDYLIQSWFDQADESNATKVPFILTPPLFRLDRESDNVLRIVSTGALLPADRETLYWLSVRAIAAIPRNSDENTLQIVMRTRVKFFYRPSALNSRDAGEAFRALKFTRRGGELVISNPTAYYVSFLNLKVGGKTVENPGMVAPFAEHRVKASGSGDVEWQTINDYGGYSEMIRRPVSSQ